MIIEVSQSPINIEIHENGSNVEVTTIVNNTQVEILQSGIQGPQGIQGVQGETGPQGAQGIQGILGPIGPQGLKGEIGLPGPVGATGLTGPQGPQGIQGPQGLQGPIGLQGPQGIQGDSGPQGPAGADGINNAQILTGAGAPSNSLGSDGDFYTDTNSPNNFYSKASGTWILKGQLKGATGPTGATGATGPQGLQGPQGETGATGPQGPSGTNGTNGINGTNGVDGVNGIDGTNGLSAYEVAVSNGFIGNESDWLLSLIGEQGPQGLTGATGPQGAKGDTGNTGAQGPQGIQGATGNTGPQGPIGLTGPIGPTGETGQGVPVGGTLGQVLKKNSGLDFDTVWTEESGVVDHNSLTGLSSDDHPQYHNDTRGDARYYTKSQTQSALDLKQDLLTFTPENIAHKNSANGYAGIDGSGKIPLELLPASLMNLHGAWDASTNTPTLSNSMGADVGDVYECVVAGTVDFGNGPITFKVGDWAVFDQYGHFYRSPNSNDVTSVNGKTGAVSLDKTDIGLSSVDNTSDADKAISNLTQTALNGKVNKTGDTMSAPLLVNNSGYIGTFSDFEVSFSNPTADNSANYGRTGWYNYQTTPTHDRYIDSSLSEYIAMAKDSFDGTWSRVVIYNDKIKMFSNNGTTTSPIMPISGDDVVVKKFVDDNFLPKTGGVITGQINAESGTQVSVHSSFGITCEDTSLANVSSQLTKDNFTIQAPDGLDFRSFNFTPYSAELTNDTDTSGIFRTFIEPARIKLYNAVSGVGIIPTTPIDPEEVTTKFYTDATFAKLSGATFTGSISATNLSGTNTGDETSTTIKTKIGASSASNDGYLSQTDWATFNNKEPAHFIPKLSGNETFRGYLTQNNSTTITAENIAAIAVNGTATARSVAITNMLTKQVRAAYAVSTPAANGVCGLRCSQLLWSVGSGFRFQTTFAFTDTGYNVGARQYYGLHSVATGLNISSTVTVESLTNIIVIGSDANDTALSIFHNDATGTATKITLNATHFPANRTAGAASTDIFSIEFYNALGSTEVKYRVTNLTTQVVAQGTLSTDLPATLLTFQTIRTSGASSNACSFDWTKTGVWSLN